MTGNHGCGGSGQRTMAPHKKIHDTKRAESQAMRWENKTIQESGKNIEWHPVFRAGEHTPRIGVSADGMWLIESNDPAFVSEDPLGFLHCLELDYPALVSLLDARLSAPGLAPSFASSFPFEKACIVALPIPSMYWPGKALTWLTFFKPEDITPALLDGIEQLRCLFPRTQICSATY